MYNIRSTGLLASGERVSPLYVGWASTQSVIDGQQCRLRLSAWCVRVVHTWQNTEVYSRRGPLTLLEQVEQGRVTLTRQSEVTHQTGPSDHLKLQDQVEQTQTTQRIAQRT